MHQRFAERIEQGLERLAQRIEHSTKPLSRSALDRQIGRLLGANSHAAGRYQIDLVDDPTCAAGFTLQVSIKAQSRVVSRRPPPRRRRNCSSISVK